MAEFTSKTARLHYHTTGRLHFITITPDVEKIIADSGIETGIAVLQTHHTTCGVWVNENEKNLVGLEGDLRKVLDRFAGPDAEYGHNDVKDSKNPTGKRDTHLCAPDSYGVIHECRNGHSHAQGMVIPCSLSMVIQDGKLLKGRWQEILLVEMDHDRPRDITVLVQGIKKK